MNKKFISRDETGFMRIRKSNGGKMSRVENQCPEKIKSSVRLWVRSSVDTETESETRRDKQRQFESVVVC